VKALAVIAIALAASGCVSQTVNLKLNSPEQQAKERAEWNKRFPGQYPPLQK